MTNNNINHIHTKQLAYSQTKYQNVNNSDITHYIYRGIYRVKILVADAIEFLATTNFRVVMQFYVFSYMTFNGFEWAV